jgi:ubiquinone/menaquinone biosynthesis C-methylase UbiE
MSLFKLRKSGGPRELELSMAGLKLGSRVLQLDGGDTELLTAMASVVGLSGHTCVVVQDAGDVEGVTKAAVRAGVLIEVEVANFTSLPYETETFDLVVIKDLLGQMRQNDRVLSVQQVNRVLRPGGRCLVIEPSTRGGLGALFSKRTLDPHYSVGGAEVTLKAEGFLGVRILADRDGTRFTEGMKLTERTGF